MRGHHLPGRPVRGAGRAIAIVVPFTATLCIAGCCDYPPTSPEPIPTKLAFLVQPTSFAVGELIAPPVRVAVRDGGDNAVPGAADTITLTISAGTGTAGAVLVGSVTSVAVNGIATFDDLTIDKAGGGYALTAAATDLADATSAIFDVEPPPNPASITLVSDLGDWVGGGFTYQYTHTDTEIVVTTIRGYLHVAIDGREWWYGDFEEPDSLTQLVPGLYAGVTRYPFHDKAVGGLSWGGESRGCNTLTGWFAIDSVAYRDGALALIDLRFEQHCEGLAPALRGTIHWKRG